mmetsp:Transcript_58317/g.92577  ORF Transcript_58317/g.92577 Transcript_58317/m.92577 type:complete len:1224 (-) Transcript_58317:186-3857(-)
MEDESGASGGSGEDPLLAGEEALITTADMLYQKMHGDPRLEAHFQNVDLHTLAEKLRRLLSRTFDVEWPLLRTDQLMADDDFDEFANVLTDAFFLVETDDVLLDSLDVLENEMRDDERLTRFLDHIRNARVEGAEEEVSEQEDEAVDESSHRTDPGAAGSEVNTKSFDNLVLDPVTIQNAKDAWSLFISTAESREAAGEAIYSAIFEGNISLQHLFTTPRVVAAMRFLNGLSSFVMALDDPPKLKVLVETMGFGHLHYDVTVPRVVIFRDSLLDLFAIELADKFSSAAYDGWKSLLNYIGGAIIFVKSHYAERVTVLRESWGKANHGEKMGKEGEAITDSAEAQKEEEIAQKKKRLEEQDALNQASKSKWLRKKQKAGNQGHVKDATGNQEAVGVPTTYSEMFLFNAAVMGFGKSVWMNEVIACFDNIVCNVSNSQRLQEECDVLALRIARCTKGSVNLPEYKSCMLASLRSLLPKDWDSVHEVAWTWLWENVERLLKRVEGSPAIWEKALNKYMGSLDEDSKYEIRKEIYQRFFALAPTGQDFFKQSNSYMHFIADRVMQMTLELYQNPVKMVDDISAIGLRHVGYNVPTELFAPMVIACVEVMQTRTTDETAIEAYRWSMGLIAKILTRTIAEGSTIVMQAVNSNSTKLLRNAISCAPRGERATWMLTVQVGTQCISPLAWSIKSGNFDATVAIIRDLLTFRADRDRYYYGVDELFKRHPDIIKMLCDIAPYIIPTLLDGLIWRSRSAESGMRRVNYYVKHLIVDEDGNFNKTLSWVTDTQDPKLLCHPVMVLVSDIVWRRLAYRTFLFGKSWLMLTIVVFVMSQSILEQLNDEKGDIERYSVFVCRCFVYLLSMTRLFYSHIIRCYRCIRDQNLHWVCGKVPIPKYMVKWQEIASFNLMISLMAMLTLEPILWCMSTNHDKLFNGDCPEKEGLRTPYSIFSMIAMFLYFLLLTDLTIVSTKISAFNLVCIRMLPEVTLFVGSLAICVLTFSSALSVLEHDENEFAGIQKGSFALFRMALGIYNPFKYKDLREEPVILAVVFIFCLTIVVFLLNMLIAQLSCAYSSVYDDMVGYARLQRGKIICELMPSISKRHWLRFTDSLNLQKKIHFNEGDVGVAGGLATKEPASLNPTTVDRIRRYAGSTALHKPWPEDDQVGDCDGDESALDKFEKSIQRTLQKVKKKNDTTSKFQGRKQRGGAGQSSSLEKSGSEESAASAGSVA